MIESLQKHKKIFGRRCLFRKFVFANLSSPRIGRLKIKRHVLKLFRNISLFGRNRSVPMSIMSSPARKALCGSIGEDSMTVLLFTKVSHGRGSIKNCRPKQKPSNATGGKKITAVKYIMNRLRLKKKKYSTVITFPTNRITRSNVTHLTRKSTLGLLRKV